MYMCEYSSGFVIMGEMEKKIFFIYNNYLERRRFYIHTNT